MAHEIGSDVYRKLGVTPVINAAGSTTSWGGSTPSQTVRRAMDDAEKSWVEMGELLKKSGARIAELFRRRRETREAHEWHVGRASISYCAASSPGCPPA